MYKKLNYGGWNYYSLRDFAYIVGVDSTYIRSIVEERCKIKLEFIKIGKKIFIRDGETEKFKRKIKKDTIVFKNKIYHSISYFAWKKGLDTTRVRQLIRVGNKTRKLKHVILGCKTWIPVKELSEFPVKKRI